VAVPSGVLVAEGVGVGVGVTVALEVAVGVAVVLGVAVGNGVCVGLVAEAVRVAITACRKASSVCVAFAVGADAAVASGVFVADEVAVTVGGAVVAVAVVRAMAGCVIAGVTAVSELFLLKICGRNRATRAKATASSPKATGRSAARRLRSCAGIGRGEGASAGETLLVRTWLGVLPRLVRPVVLPPGFKGSMGTVASTALTCWGVGVQVVLCASAVTKARAVA
jgi:hypothetical protein